MNRRTNPHKRAPRGMVLMEVVMALFIFTLVAFALVMALDSAMDAAKKRNEIDAAMRGLSNQLALLHAAPLVVGDKDLVDDDTNSIIAYHLNVVPEPMKDQKGANVPAVYRATITATWKTAADKEDRSVSELIYQP